ncbi:putative regulatory protein, TetR family [Luteimicrobium album]|uniref:Regulatory protein, TetR family n=1 Tax=Luteimicrobium album TaxID=1054550 RepID=A0ABQ6I1G0_9MICO|nr:TetR/AcrR family transcriptional regulator [Luteimicrobium album]GMA24062.1 putative regulatory protein, TetR family [Luteimicrobium album]
MLEGMTLLAPADAPPAPDLRARKREATREALATAAFALARDHGLDGFTVDDVARRADVSRRTFFNYFTSKEQAVTAVVGLRISSLLDEVETRIAGEQQDSQGADKAGYDLLDLAVRTLLSTDSVETFRALIRLAEDSPELVPHLAGIEHTAGDHVVELMRRKSLAEPGVELQPVLAYAIPGAIIATVGAVYSRRLHIREVDGDAPESLALDDVIGQLRSLLPPMADYCT